MSSDYFTYGAEWEEALETLAEISGSALDIEDVSHIIDQRFPDDAMLQTDVSFLHPLSHPQVWAALCQVNPRIQRMLRQREEIREHKRYTKDQTKAWFACLSSSELRAINITRDNASDIARTLAKCVTVADRDHLIRLAQEGDRWQRLVAFRALEPVADVTMLPMLLAFLASDAAIPGVEYGAVVRVLVALPADVTHQIAHAWCNATDSMHRHVGVMLLEKHATSEDILEVCAWLLASLERDIVPSNECYLQGSMLKIVTRFPNPHAYTVAETVFIEAKYARNRIHAARALLACDPVRFCQSLATECLWDSEDQVRMIGCESVTNAPDALARVQALASDPYEDEAVRAAATKRLASRCYIVNR